MDFARVAGGDKKIAFSIERQRPDIFGLGIVEDFELAVRRDLVDFAIGAVPTKTRSLLSTAMA